MNTHRAYKLRLYPSREQRELLNQQFGAARWAWNRALEYRSKAYRRRGESVSGVDFSRLLTRLKQTRCYGWLADVPASVFQQKLRDQDTAFKNFLAGRARYPRFKRRGGLEVLRLTLDARHVGYVRDWEGGAIRVPKLGTIKYRGNNHPNVMPKLVTIRRDACGHYYASFAAEAEVQQPLSVTSGATGVDLGVTTLATLSDGTKVENPKHYNKRLRQLRHRQRVLSRRCKGSNRYRDAQRRVARTHRHIRASRNDALHKLTTALSHENQWICVEDLHVRGMVRNRRLARSIADCGFGELRRQLEYKACWYGRTLVVVDRWLPSSKQCADCGHRLNNLDLSVRQWTCPECGTLHDSDHNAARNILAEGLRQLEPAGSRGLRVEGRSAGPVPDRLASQVLGETPLGEARIACTEASADGPAVTP